MLSDRSPYKPLKEERTHFINFLQSVSKQYTHIWTRFLNQNIRHPNSGFVFFKTTEAHYEHQGKYPVMCCNPLPVFPPGPLGSQASCLLPAQSCICLSVSHTKECGWRQSTVHVKLVTLIYYSLATKKLSSVSWLIVGCTPKAETTRSLHIPEGHFGMYATGEGTLGRRVKWLSLL